MANQAFLLGLETELSKLGYLESSMPFSDKLKVHKKWLEAKSKKTPPSHGKVLGVGGLAGGALGGIAGGVGPVGSWKARLGAAALGVLGGGALGALVGEIVRAGEIKEINKAKRIVNASNYPIQAKRDLIKRLDEMREEKEEYMKAELEDLRAQVERG